MLLNLLTDEIKGNLSNPKVFKFKTNAQKFEILFSVKDISKGNFPHIGISSREGIMVLYRKHSTNDEDSSKERTWYNVECYTSRYDTTVYMHHLVKPGEIYEVMIYGPILSTLESLQIQAPEASILSSIENNYEKKILLCGGLTSLGVGCTTPALTFSSILTRKLNVSIDNITFYNLNYLDKVYQYCKNQEPDTKYDVGILELDYVNQKDDIVEKYLQNIITLLSNQCKQLICWILVPNYKEYKKENAERAIANVNNENIIFKDFSYLNDMPYKDICTYSANFINDSGNRIIYKEFSQIIRSL